MKKQVLSDKEEKNLYLIGAATGVLFFCLVFFFHHHPEIMKYVFPGCIFQKYTGLYCPGCGGTRAVNAMLCGRFLQSLWYHPVVLYSCLLYSWYMISHTIQYLSRDRWKIGLHYRHGYVIAGLFLAIFHCVAANMLLIFGNIPLEIFK